jgi:DnaJ-domain-containing protein 1
VASSQNKRAQAKARQEMKRRVVEIQARVTKDIDYAFEALLQEQPDLSLKMEGALEEVLRMVGTIDGEIEDVSSVAELERLDRRIEFIEEQFEDIEAELYGRPRRRRKRRPNLFDFFRQATGGGGWGGDSSDPQGEVRTAADAFAVLGLEEGSSYQAVTKAFRKKAKELHPDSRDGDRSGEVQLRKLIAAYQYIKTIYNWGEDKPAPGSPNV